MRLWFDPQLIAITDNYVFGVAFDAYSRFEFYGVSVVAPSEMGVASLAVNLDKLADITVPNR